MGQRVQVERLHHRVESFTDKRWGNPIDGQGHRKMRTECGLTVEYDFGDDQSNHMLEGPAPKYNRCQVCFGPDEPRPPRPERRRITEWAASPTPPAS